MRASKANQSVPFPSNNHSISNNFDKKIRKVMLSRWNSHEIIPVWLYYHCLKNGICLSSFFLLLESIQLLLHIFFCFWIADSSCDIYGACYTGNKSKTPMIVGITLGCIALCLSICCVYLCKRKRGPISNLQNNPPACNQDVPANVYRMTYVDRNGIRINTVQMPYIISMAAARASSVEQPPPSYDVAVSSLGAQERWMSNRLWQKKANATFFKIQTHIIVKKSFGILPFIS